MAFKEIIFERLSGALEDDRGVAEAAPTHVFNFPGLLTPAQDYDEQQESRGTKWVNYSSEVARQGAVFSTPDQPVDPALLTFWLNMGVNPVTTPSQPDAVNWPNTYLWQFAPSAAADDAKSATVWWGDAIIQYWRSDYALLNSMNFSNDGNAVQGMRFSMDGMAGFPTQVAAPTLPANIGGRLIQNMVRGQLWIDTSSAIGTTEVTDRRLVSATHRLTTGLFPKFLAAGPLASMDYSDIGLDQAGVRLITELVMEVPDMNEYDLFEAGTVCKVRVRHNGPMIDEYGGGSNSYRYVEFDTYGPLKFRGWGNNRGNRTARFAIESLHDATLNAPFRVAVQNNRSTL